MSKSSNETLMRQWVMLRLIPRAPRKTTAQELQAGLSLHGFTASSRTVERDLQGLSRHFELVADETNKPFGWSWAKNANFQFTPRLSATQAVALLLARMHLRTFLPQSVLRDLAPLLHLAEHEVASTGWRDWDKRTAIVPATMPLMAPNISANVLDNVHRALGLRRCLSGSYRSKGSHATKELTIHPLGLLIRGAVQYLVCTLRDYRDIRVLALHRLSSTTVLDKPCSEPSGFNFQEYIASQGCKYHARGKIRLVARFTAEAGEHLGETPISKDQVLRKVDDTGEIELTAAVENDDTLRWWLLGFGSRVEVLAPKDLREELHADLVSAAARYSSGEGRRVARHCPT